LPALFLTSFLILEHYQDMDFGSVAFFASSCACLVTAVLTILMFKPPEQQPIDQFETIGAAGGSSVASIVDITVLWAFIIAFLDGDDGLTKGGLAFALSVAAVPFLHFRGYPLLLAAVPLLLPLTLIFFLSSMDTESSMEIELVTSLCGCATSASLILLSMIKISPPIAGDASEFTSMALTLNKQQYHAFLHWAGTGWMYIWIVFGFYVTEISVAAALVGTLVIGVTNLTLGIQNDSMLLRMSGLAELCIAIFLGAVSTHAILLESIKRPFLTDCL